MFHMFWRINKGLSWNDLNATGCIWFSVCFGMIIDSKFCLRIYLPREFFLCWLTIGLFFGLSTGYTTSTFQKGRSFQYYVGNWLLRAKVGWRLYQVMWSALLGRNKYCLTGMKLRKDMVYHFHIILLTDSFCSSCFFFKHL